jgi:hypothetical protein
MYEYERYFDATAEKDWERKAIDCDRKREWIPTCPDCGGDR